MKGFTLIEILITLAIFGIISTIGVNSYQQFQLKKQQDQIVFEIITTLEQQKTNSQTGKEGKNFGVQFNPSTFVLFSGSVFTNSEQNKIIKINEQFQISETISNSDNIIYFSKVFGESNESVSITISHITNRIPQKEIKIEKSGAISVIE